MKFTRDHLLIFLAVLALTLTSAVFAADEVPTPTEPKAENGLDLAEVLGTEVRLAGDCLTCTGNYNTGQVWEMGSDCASAATATENAARAVANAYCQSIGSMPYVACNFTFYVDACYNKDGGKVVDGHATYGCWEGDFFCPEF